MGFDQNYDTRGNVLADASPPEAMLCTYTVVYDAESRGNGSRGEVGCRQESLVFAYTAELAVDAIRRHYGDFNVFIVGVIDGGPRPL